MFKKTVPAVLALCMVLSSLTVFGTGYQLALNDDELSNPSVVLSSADAETVKGKESILNDSIIGDQHQLNDLSPEQTPTVISTQNNENTTVDVLTGHSAILNENNTKNNAMSAKALDEIPASSRYSTVKISLAPDIAGTKYEEAAELLGALGIMVGDAEDGAFRPNDAIIRSEMAKVAVYSVGLEDMALSSNGHTDFPDVPSDHWATGAINVAHGQGMVVGDDVGTYRPDDPVLLQEAVAIMVRAMGYEPAAQNKGGYPAGYLSVASSNQLLRGISGTATNAATRGDIAQLIFNSLTVKLMEQVTYGSETRYEVVDKTLLYDKLNVEKGYGQVKATDETSLNGGSVAADGKIQVDDKLFNTGTSNAKSYLGYNVLYYARIDKTDDEKTIIDIRPQSNKNKFVTINAGDIVNASGEDNKTIEYWAKDNDKNTQTAQIAKDAVFIYNGKHKDVLSSDKLKPTSGNLILLDADTNGIYEIAFVNHFTNIVVDTVSDVTGRVTDKYLNGSLVFKDQDNDVICTLTKNGEEITVEDLKEWNVISYTISEDKKLIKGYVSDASLNGKITEITEGGYRIGSASELYKKASSYPSDIELGDKGTFYLDIEGKIAAVDENAVSGTTEETKKYGYLTDAAMNNQFEATAKFKIFTASGQTSVLNSTEKLRFNKNYATKAEDVIDGLKSEGQISPQLIIYETNSKGEITAIETAYNGLATGAPNKGTFTLNISRNDMVYKSASGKLGSVGIDDNTIIFDIPSVAGSDTDKFTVRNKSSLSNDTSYSAKVYDLQDNYVAKAIIITNSTGMASAEQPITVVDHISETQNDDYEITDRLYGLQGGKEISVLATDKTVLTKNSGSPLEKGDIIQYRTDSDGEIDGITLLFDVSAKNTEFITEITNDMTCVYGRVTKKFAGSINVSVNNDIKNWATTDTVVYMYDSSKHNGSLKQVTPSDIEIYEEDNEARLFLRVYRDKVEEMVIVK